MSNDNQMGVSGALLIAGEVELIEEKIVWHLMQSSLTDCLKLKRGIRSPEFTTRVGEVSVKWALYLLLPCKNNEKKIFYVMVKCLNQQKFKATITFNLKGPCKSVNLERSDMLLGENVTAFLCGLDGLLNQNTTTTNNKYTLIYAITIQNSKLLSEVDCLNQFKTIVNNQQFSDVVLSMQGKELYAYKGILACRSSVFMAMFSHNTTELTSSRIEISDISYDTMHHLLHYIYTDVIPQFENDESQDKRKNLLIAADKYNLSKLKLRLEEDLIPCIKVCNVFEYLSFADTYNASLLKEKAFQFITSHNNEIVNSESYKNFNILHPDLSCEVFRYVLAKRRKIDT